jgi:hypothetical protein
VQKASSGNGDDSSGGASGGGGAGQRFNYLFYIDFVGALSDPNCQNALRHLQVCMRVSRHACHRFQVCLRRQLTFRRRLPGCLPACCSLLPSLLQESAPFMRVLGSFPMETQLGGLDSNTPFDSINEHE